jgi:hypothetical protein
MQALAPQGGRQRLHRVGDRRGETGIEAIGAAQLTMTHAARP